jgi:hypothetical protein
METPDETRFGKPAAILALMTIAAFGALVFKGGG